MSATRTFEIRCPEARHLLGHLRLPATACAPGAAAVLVAVRDARCGGLQVESAFVEAGPADRAEGPWRRERRATFQVRCPSGAHLLGNVSIPAALLRDVTEPPVLFTTDCHTCGKPVETAFTALAETREAAPRGAPGKVLECARSR